MAVSPVLVIKVVGDSAVGVRARLYDDFVEHEIVLNSVLAYWWLIICHLSLNFWNFLNRL